MANYGEKHFTRFRQILNRVEGEKLPPCERDIDEVIKAYNEDHEYYNSGIDDYKKGIINIWATDTEITDDDLGLEQLKAAADAGNPNAMNLCGMAHHLVYLQGKPVLDEARLKQCSDRVIEYWTMGADHKQPEAMCNLAVCYLEGTYVKRDLLKAKSLFQEAVKAHHPAARQYLKESKLDKWNLGDDYETVHLTILQAMKIVRPKKKEPTIQEKLKGIALTAVAKNQCISLKKAMKLIQEHKPGYLIVDCIQYDYHFVFSVIDEESRNKDFVDPWNTDQYHYIINRVSKEISEHSVADMMYAVEGKHGHFETYLSEEDAAFVKQFWSDAWSD